MSIKFTISHDELAKALDITPEKLQETIEFFDSDPHDEWELVPDKDYIVVKKSFDLRKFSDKGALKIAYYFDAHGKTGFFHKVKEFITGRARRLRQSLAQKIIQEEFFESYDKIVQANGRNFAHKQCLRRILETNGQTMNKALDHLQKTSPLEIEVDFIKRNFSDPKKEKQGEQLWFSGKGSFLVSKQISENLKDNARRKQCQAVSIEIAKALQQLDDEIKTAQRKILTAKRQTKTRDRNICQIRKVKPNAVNQMTLAVHHLYSVHTHPHLATVLENLITIDSLIHEEFHVSWMGGFDKPCTVQDFINFITERYPECPNEKLIPRLYQVKKILNVDKAN